MLSSSKEYDSGGVYDVPAFPIQRNKLARPSPAKDDSRL